MATCNCIGRDNPGCCINRFNEIQSKKTYLDELSCEKCSPTNYCARHTDIYFEEKRKREQMTRPFCANCLKHPCMCKAKAMLTEIFGTPIKSRLKTEIYNIVRRALWHEAAESITHDIYTHLQDVMRLTDLMNYENTEDCTERDNTTGNSQCGMEEVPEKTV